MMHLLPKRIKLANLPTPLQQITFNNTKFFIKRDDLTGLETSGNKIRKLEYILADALRTKSDLLYTCGGDQSNHARATLFAGKSLGLDSKLFLWGEDTSSPEGNLFLNKILKPEIVYLTESEYWNVREIMIADAKKQKTKKVYIVPEGGSSPHGILGYSHCVSELYQDLSSGTKGILTAAGSGGTTAGLVLGSKLFGVKLKIFSVNVLYSKSQLENNILSVLEDTIKEFRLDIKVSHKDFEIIDGYSKEGYKSISDNKIRLIKNFAKQTGILLDPAYTGKAFCAFNDHFLKGQKSSKVIFLHTGGLFGILSKKEQYLK
ncbi:MAG: 1-aminocyclopropane-1-carboxylate deaminase/D-cysteine desulfhydrase [Ignavibacteriaceae bacterium]